MPSGKDNIGWTHDYVIGQLEAPSFNTNQTYIWSLLETRSDYLKKLNRNARHSSWLDCFHIGCPLLKTYLEWSWLTVYTDNDAFLAILNRMDGSAYMPSLRLRFRRLDFDVVRQANEYKWPGSRYTILANDYGNWRHATTRRRAHHHDWKRYYLKRQILCFGD